VLSTAPGVQTHWGQYLFPLPTVDVEPGDQLDVRLALDERGGDTTWRWAGVVHRDGDELATFNLSDDHQWLGAPVAGGRP
jgi:hypothetical protein